MHPRSSFVFPAPPATPRCVSRTAPGPRPPAGDPPAVSPFQQMSLLGCNRRPVMNRRVALLALALLAAPVQRAEATGAGTISPTTPSVTWTGGPYTAVTADPSLCTPLTCDHYSLTVNVPATFYRNNPTYTVRVHISWESTPNDFDMYVYDANGNEVNSSAQGSTTFEEVDLGQVTSGTFDVQIVAFLTANEGYSGIASLGSPPPDQGRTATYRNGNFS